MKARLLHSALLALCICWHALAAPPAQPPPTIDPERWYHLTNDFLGEERALEVDSAEQDLPYMGRTRTSGGQLWRLSPVQSGLYRITNQRLGEGWALGLDPQDPSVPRLVPAGKSPQQLWKLTPQEEGYWRLTNQALGKKQALDTYSDGDNAPFMGETGEYSGQFWKLSDAGKIDGAAAAPLMQAEASPRRDTPQPSGPASPAEQAYRQQQLLGKTAAAPLPAAGPDAFPPPIRTFSFAPAEQKILPGTSAQSKAGFANCDGVVHDGDRIGNLALLSQFYQNDCYTDGRYNHADYQVERGTLKSADGGIAVEAYHVYGPARKAGEFLGSNHILSFRIATAGDHILYTWDGNRVAAATRIARSQVVPGGYTDIDSVSVSELAGPRVFFLWPATQPFGAYHQLAPGVQGATLGQSAAGTLAKFCYQVQGTPFDTRTAFPYGPASHENVYGQCRQFFPLDLGSQIGVVWQDQKTRAVNLTRLQADLKGQTTAPIAENPGMRLAAAATDQQALYLLLIQDGEQDQKSKRVLLQKADLKGKILLEKAHDSGAAGLNITLFGADNIASMAISGGKIGVILGRTMHLSEDGINHQGAIGVVFSAANLSLIENLGQTSGHSFDSYLTPASSGGFLGIDLGDNYPRGVNLHRFSASGMESQVIYTFKTAHGTEARNPAGKSFPRYAAASAGGQTFYQWSNDNCTYTELGALVEAPDGYLVFIVGEPDAQNRSLNNSRLRGEYLTDARNVGLVKVRKDFADTEAGSEGPNVVPPQIVLSKGPAEDGGFYDFDGGWNAQRNAGVNWITSYRDPKTANASRLRAVPLAADTTLLLWEVWATAADTADDAGAYRTTCAVRVDAAGRPLSQPVELGSQVRIGRRDDVLVKNGAGYLVTGDAAGKTLEVLVLKP